VAGTKLVPRTFFDNRWRNVYRCGMGCLSVRRPMPVSAKSVVGQRRVHHDAEPGIFPEVALLVEHSGFTAFGVDGPALFWVSVALRSGGNHDRHYSTVLL
jgi:hypothetical protein